MDKLDVQIQRPQAVNVKVILYKQMSTLPIPVRSTVSQSERCTCGGKVSRTQMVCAKRVRDSSPSLGNCNTAAAARESPGWFLGEGERENFSGQSYKSRNMISRCSSRLIQYSRRGRGRRGGRSWSQLNEVKQGYLKQVHYDLVIR